MTKKTARALTARALIVVALVFVVTSVSQIIITVFGDRPAQAPATTEDLACASRLRVLEGALERASDSASRAPEAKARASFEQAVSPEWDNPGSDEQLCASPRSRDAWTALLRLRRTLEGRAEKDAREVDPVRRDFEARLP